MHDTAENAALAGRASLQAQRKGLSSPSPLQKGLRIRVWGFGVGDSGLHKVCSIQGLGKKKRVNVVSRSLTFRKYTPLTLV